MNCKNCNQIASGNFCTHCGQQAIIYTLSSIFSLMVAEKDYFLVLITLGISISYAMFVFGQFFVEQSRVLLVLRSIVTYALYLIIPILLIGLVFGALQ